MSNYLCTILINFWLFQKEPISTTFIFKRSFSFFFHNYLYHRVAITFCNFRVCGDKMRVKGQVKFVENFSPRKLPNNQRDRARVAIKILPSHERGQEGEASRGNEKKKKKEGNPRKENPAKRLPIAARFARLKPSGISFWFYLRCPRRCCPRDVCSCGLSGLFTTRPSKRTSPSRGGGWRNREKSDITPAASATLSLRFPNVPEEEHHHPSWSSRSGCVGCGP